jgi:hypothetical protein
MAAPIYCTHKELKRVFPQLDSFDGKKPIYGWTALFTHAGFSLYQGDNSGLVTDLFKDGQDLSSYQKTENYVDSTTNTDEAIDIIETAIDVVDGSVFAYGDIIKIDDEKMLITNISGNTITVDRGFLGTSTATHSTATDIYIGVTWTEENQWLYSSQDDEVLIYANTFNPADLLIEAGEQFTTVVTQYRTDASRYLDSMLDPNMPKEAWKDKEGNYDYIIIRTTALVAANFMIKSHDPNSELANALMEEAMQNIENINQGKAALSWQVTRDSAQGVVRDVVYPTAGAIRPVDTRGEWYGTYDLIKVLITTAGALGEAKYEVYTKDSTKLKNQLAQSATIISGDYQPLAGGLEIRFAGSTDAIQNNEWEIECFGVYEDVDASSGKSVKMTRTRKTSFRRYETE